MPLLAGLLYPMLFAAGAAAATVPIIIHLLNRRRVRPLRWAAMSWLLAALKKHQKRLKMENWLILALRVAALLLLGLGLSHVVLSDSALLALSKPKRSVILLLDTSFSTAARDGARSVSDRIREEADRVLSGLGAEDTVSVVTSNDVRGDRAGTRPQVLVTRAVGREGISRAKALLGSVRPTEAPAPWAEALAACSPKALLQETDTNRLLVWITDLQASDWRRPPPDQPADPVKAALEGLKREGCEIAVVDANGAEGRSLPNLAVSDLSVVGSGDVFQGQWFAVRAVVSNHGDVPIEGASVRLFLDDAPAPVRTVRVPGVIPASNPVTGTPGEQSVEVVVPRELAWKTAGGHAVRAEVAPPESRPGADVLGLDSRRVLAMEVRSRLRVVAWVSPSRDSKWETADALQGIFVGEGAGDVFEFEAARSEEDLRRSLSDAARETHLVILGNRLPRSAEARRELVAFVRSGGALLVFTGDAFDVRAWNEEVQGGPDARFLPFEILPAETRRYDEGAWRLAFEAETPHPLSHRFAKEEAAELVKAYPPLFYGRTPIRALRATSRDPKDPATAAEEAMVVFRWKDAGGGPGPIACVEGPFGLGRTLWFGSSLDDAWTPTGIWLYAALLNDAALLLTQQAGAGRNLLVGGAIQAWLPKDATDPRLSIPGRGEEVPTIRAAQVEGERSQALYDRVGTAGVWRLSFARPAGRGATTSTIRREDVFAVNPDPREGALARARHDDVATRAPSAEIQVLSTWQEAGSTQAVARQGDVTHWVLLLVLAFLMLEPYLAMRFGRHDVRPGQAVPPSP